MNALITGITGQDGSYLSELLLAKGYKVFGLIRRISTPNLHNLTTCLNNPNFKLIDGDITDLSSIIRALEISKPDEVYNLAAMSYVGTSWQQPLLTYQVTGLGAINIFEAVRLFNPTIKVYQASSSEMFGDVLETPQKETTPLNPRSPYGVAKCQAHLAAKNYNDSFGMFICTGILFNHESERRGVEFVTRKISRGIAQIVKQNPNYKIPLGNLEAKRDWGYALDYMEAAWLMLQQDNPDSYVIATGETHTIRELLIEAFSIVNLNYEDHIFIDPQFIRPAEVNLLLGDYSKAKLLLNWSPKTSFKELVSKMVLADLNEE